jgi:hypothetical protein
VDSLTRTRYLRRLAVALGVGAVVALVAIPALRPAPQPAPEDEFADSVLATRPQDLTPDQREQLRRQWESFPPETRARVFRAVATARLDEMRADVAGLTPAARSERIRTAVLEMRRRREQLSSAEQAHIRERLQDPQTREMVKQVMGFYREELTARERAELDPLLQEWLVQIERLSGRR